MTKNWLSRLVQDPLPPLLHWPDKALVYFVNRDLAETQGEPIEAIWRLPEAARLVRKQLEDGSWKYHGKTRDPATGQNYFLLETYRNLRALVEMYGFTRVHPVRIPKRIAVGWAWRSVGY